MGANACGFSTEQRLNAGESVDMPVFFFIDPDFVKDPTMKGIDTVTLSYTFFSKFIQFRFEKGFSCLRAGQRHGMTKTGI